jgi:tetratricopeptide (TPR) repeat protein
MIFLQKEKFDLCHMFLKKAELLAMQSNHHRAITYNNLACYYRRIKKYRSALTYLENALAIELKLESVDSLADTRLNMCAVLSQLNQHTEALEHVMMSIVMLQEDILGNGKNKNTERLPVLAIAYDNMGVEL